MRDFGADGAEQLDGGSDHGGRTGEVQRLEVFAQETDVLDQFLGGDLGVFQNVVVEGEEVEDDVEGDVETVLAGGGGETGTLLLEDVEEQLLVFQEVLVVGLGEDGE